MNEMRSNLNKHTYTSFQKGENKWSLFFLNLILLSLKLTVKTWECHFILTLLHPFLYTHFQNISSNINNSIKFLINLLHFFPCLCMPKSSFIVGCFGMVNNSTNRVVVAWVRLSVLYSGLGRWCLGQEDSPRLNISDYAPTDSPKKRKMLWDEVIWRKFYCPW